MEKLKVGILIILVIFIIGGSYAVYLGNNSNNDNSSNIPSNTETSITNSTTNNDMNPNPNTDIKSSNSNEISYRNIPGTMIRVNASLDYTDLYQQCAICGGFVPLGEVTKALPEDAICPDLCNGLITIGGSGSGEGLYTYEEAYTFWLEYGRHPEEISNLYNDINIDQSANNPDANQEIIDEDSITQTKSESLPSDYIVVIDTNQYS